LSIQQQPQQQIIAVTTIENYPKRLLHLMNINNNNKSYLRSQAALAEKHS
jgi:hypothetical protein